MKFTNELITKVNDRIVTEKGNPGTTVHLTATLGISKDMMVFANVQQLSRVIDDLIILREALLEETGIEF